MEHIYRAGFWVSQHAAGWNQEVKFTKFTPVPIKKVMYFVDSVSLEYDGWIAV